MATRKPTSAPRKSSREQKPWEDEVLREVYAARESYAAEHGYDLDRIYADLKRSEASECEPVGPGLASRQAQRQCAADFNQQGRLLAAKRPLPAVGDSQRARR